MITEQTIKTALSSIIDPDSGRDVVSAGLISGIVVRGEKVGFAITIRPADKERREPLRAACEAAVKTIAGVDSVTAVLTADMAAAPAPALPPRAQAQWNTTPLAHVGRIIAVASGKGGVGKSTTTVNLALALTRAGKRVGILDADIYGPSIPRMLGLASGREPAITDGKMQPLTAHGISCMSMGFITGDEAAVMRGPMISKTLTQLLRLTAWGTPVAPLDTLFVDMPPGTGDIHLSMAQLVPLTGAIIVTTPQEVAVMDARKCASMFLKVNVPVIGVVENMSGSIFGSGGGERLAAELSVPLLGRIAMDAAICTAGDTGAAYSGENAITYDKISLNLM